ncbi:MAG: undecaprenyldiphospho-muramoylpentapeptide beta-N-acetylglucosaminyltransferase [Clostridiales Family XIII bacterium]|jgi:UDP-N-acetylglucosamine--N-acetylmuramyl-(pentapeptide) pyrophosphoryl-undecaprenol N-acetylglucosamine transferase|nr:undecaprenyldiphospho-muramoylpentapeptide beta-N-acetylglucosaminyltransferase [Clostridiales Family XIII bacterium]
MRIIMASSATGGHIYPALAVAEKVKHRDPDAEILFIGAKKEISSDIVSNAGYDCKHIDVRGFNRRNMLKNISVAKDLVAGSSQIKKIIRDFKPDVVFGTGGYVCGPVVKEAHKMGIRTYIHEQNVVPGMANKLAEKYADKIFAAFPEAVDYFKKKDKVIVTGNPVRDVFVNLDKIDYRQLLKIPDGETVILIFGGSQGANAINDAALDFITEIPAEKNISVFFITGKRSYWEVSEKLSRLDIKNGKAVHVLDYTETIHEYFGAANLIVSRSGALTLSEIAVSGRASILVPSPNVTGNHQYFNAKMLADRGAAVIMNDEEIANGGLAAKIFELADDPEKLEKMGNLAKSAARTDSADIIFNEIYERKNEQA